MRFAAISRMGNLMLKDQYDRTVPRSGSSNKANGIFMASAQMFMFIQ